MFMERTSMKRSFVRLAVFVTLLLVATVSALAQDVPTEETAALDAEAILDRVNAAWQGDSFHGVVYLEITIGGATKLHTLEIWTLGEELALVRVLEPELDRNSGYLQLGDELWYSSPTVGAIKLPAMAIGEALFGAGPSLEDLSHGTLSEDYDVAVSVLEDDPNDESDAYWLLTLVPHLDAPVVYGKLEIWVTAEFVMERLVYYDQRGEVLQTAAFSEVVEIGARKVSTKIVLEDRFGDRTVQRIEDPQFDLELHPTFFSIETFASWGETE